MRHINIEEFTFTNLDWEEYLEDLARNLEDEGIWNYNFSEPKDNKITITVINDEKQESEVELSFIEEDSEVKVSYGNLAKDCAYNWEVAEFIRDNIFN